MHADPFKVIAQAQTKLALNAAPVQIPLGLEERHAGLVDLLTMQAHHFEGAHGQDIVAVGCACHPHERLLLVLSTLSIYQLQLKLHQDFCINFYHEGISASTCNAQAECCVSCSCIAIAHQR